MLETIYQTKYTCKEKTQQRKNTTKNKNIPMKKHSKEKTQQRKNTAKKKHRVKHKHKIHNSYHLGHKLWDTLSQN